MIILEFLFIILSVSAGVFLGQLLFHFVKKDITESDGFRKAQRIAGIRPQVAITSPSKILKEKQFLNEIAQDEQANA